MKRSDRRVTAPRDPVSVLRALERPRDLDQRRIKQGIDQGLKDFSDFAPAVIRILEENDRKRTGR